MPAKADPTLIRQLEESGDESVSAVFHLRSGAADPALPPDETEEAARQVLARVTGSVGVSPDGVHVFRNLGAFSVRAKPPFLRELLDQPEIASAIANRQDADVVIRPVPPPRRRAARIRKKVSR